MGIPTFFCNESSPDRYIDDYACFVDSDGIVVIDGYVNWNIGYSYGITLTPIKNQVSLSVPQ